MHLSLLSPKHLWFYELLLESWTEFKTIDEVIHITLPDNYKIPNLIAGLFTVISERKTTSICEEAECIVDIFRKGNIIKVDDKYYLNTFVRISSEEEQSYL